ncbi:MAG: K+-transporting ATPase ATPase B chain, partial [Comamonadaceae bacterium]
MKKKTTLTLLDPVLLKPAVRASFAKLSPAVQWRNPVMFVVYLGSIVTTLLGLQAQQDTGFILTISAWLWFTVLFANFAESLAEGRAKAQSASLRGLKQSTWAKKLKDPVHGSTWLPQQAENLRKGDVVLVDAGEMIPLDGDVIQGVATVDESAITGESAPVVRE